MINVKGDEKDDSMIKIIKLILTGTCLSLLSFPALSSNYNFLNDTAASYFTQEDWNIFNKTQKIALDSGKTGIKIKWQNPNSGSYGYMIPGKITRENGMMCRSITFYNTANLIHGGGTNKFCKSQNKWMIY
jgi:surface antigen